MCALYMNLESKVIPITFGYVVMSSVVLLNRVQIVLSGFS